jgi:hypothetical protein
MDPTSVIECVWRHLQKIFHDDIIPSSFRKYLLGEMLARMRGLVGPFVDIVRKYFTFL